MQWNRYEIKLLSQTKMWEPLALRNCVIILQQDITVIFTHTLDVKTVIIHHNSIHKCTYIDHYSGSHNWNCRITPCVSNLHFCNNIYVDIYIYSKYIYIYHKWNKVKKTTPFTRQTYCQLYHINHRLNSCVCYVDLAGSLVSCLVGTGARRMPCHTKMKTFPYFFAQS